MGEMEIRIKELAPITERTYVEEVYTPERIREIWSGEGADKSLVLALLDKWERAEAELRSRRALDLTSAEREALDVLRRSIIEEHGGTFGLDMDAREVGNLLAVLRRLLGGGQ